MPNGVLFLPGTAITQHPVDNERRRGLPVRSVAVAGPTATHSSHFLAGPWLSRDRPAFPVRLPCRASRRGTSCRRRALTSPVPTTTALAHGSALARLPLPGAGPCCGADRPPDLHHVPASRIAARRFAPAPRALAAPILPAAASVARLARCCAPSTDAPLAAASPTAVPAARSYPRPSRTPPSRAAAAAERLARALDGGTASSTLRTSRSTRRRRRPRARPPGHLMPKCVLPYPGSGITHNSIDNVRRRGLPVRSVAVAA